MEATTTAPKFTAARLNTHLAAGGQIIVATYTQARLYKPAHAGYFTEDSKGMLFVRRGKGKVCLGPAKEPYVGIRLSRLPGNV